VQATYEFSAEVSVLTHSTTIQPRYQAVIHCEIVRQVSAPCLCGHLDAGPSGRW
jgi:GTPase